VSDGSGLQPATQRVEAGLEPVGWGTRPFQRCSHAGSRI
jgi:hypothetical protein